MKRILFATLGIFLLVSLSFMPFVSAYIDDNNETLKISYNQPPFPLGEPNKSQYWEKFNDKNASDFVNKFCIVFGHVTWGLRFGYGIVQQVIFNVLLDFLDAFNLSYLFGVVYEIYLLNLFYRPRLIYPYVEVIGKKIEVTTWGLLGHNHVEREMIKAQFAWFELFGFTGLWVRKPLQHEIWFIGIALAVK